MTVLACSYRKTPLLNPEKELMEALCLFKNEEKSVFFSLLTLPLIIKL